MARPMRRLMIAVVLLALFAAACGGDDDDGGGGGQQGTSPEACASDAVIIKMVDIKFDPQDATAGVGQQVCWVNEDTIEHNAVADNQEFKSELFGKGETFTTTVKSPGEIPYVCTVHPGMTGTITVER
jgi:plastocyanin